MGGKYVSLKTGDRILYEKVYAVIHKQSDLNVIVFETNGGTPISNYMVPTNSTFDPNIIFIPEKENAVFLGWYLDSSFTMPHIEQVITQDTTLYARWAENGIKTSIKTSVSKAEGKTSIVVTALVTDGNGTPLEGVLVNFSGSAGTWAQKTAVTNNKGEAVVEYTTGNSNPIPGLDMTELLKAVENVSFIADYTQVTVESSCPFVYSFDGQNYHFEHEAIPFSVNKALMSTSYGTLRHLREHNGLYHVRIAEMLPETSFIHGFKLYAVEYKDGQGIIEVFADIFGNPHTIKTKILPEKFEDHHGNDLLDELLMEDVMLISDYRKLYEGDYVTSYTATFARPDNTTDIAKFMVKAQEAPLMSRIWGWMNDVLDGENNMWWIEQILNIPENKQAFIELSKAVNLHVELWDGHQWVEQGQIQAGGHLLEEFLVPLDLSLVDENIDEIKVRLSFVTGLFQIDSVSMDFSENAVENVYELELSEALFNGDENVISIINDFESEDYVRMVQGDKIDLYYQVPEIRDGYERGFTVALKGYFHENPDSHLNPIVHEWEGLDAEGIIQALYEMNDKHAIDSMDDFIWINSLFTTLENASIEEKVEQIVVEHVLPWIFRDENEISVSSNIN